MASDEPDIGPLQLMVVGFETTDRFPARSRASCATCADAGWSRVVDARLLSRGADGELTETDLNEIIGDPVGGDWRPAAHLFGLNGAGNGNTASHALTPESYARTAGFEIEALRDELPPRARTSVRSRAAQTCSTSRTWGRCSPAGRRLVGQPEAQVLDREARGAGVGLRRQRVAAAFPFPAPLRPKRWAAGRQCSRPGRR